MSPQLALILTFLFILIAFIIDKKKSDVSSALWVPLIWMLYSGSRPVGYWFKSNSASALELEVVAGNPIDRLFLSIPIIVGVVILLRRKSELIEIIKANRWIFVFFLYTGISVLWSDFMQVSLKRWIRISGDLIMVLIILTETDCIQSIISIVRRFACILVCLSALTIKYFRHIGIGYDHYARESWIGITSGKNHLAQVCFFVALFLTWILLKKYKERLLLSDKIQLSIDIFLLIVALWMLQGSPTVDSATALIVYIMSTFCLIVLIKVRPNPKKLGRIAAIILFILFSVNLFANISFDRGLVEIAIHSFDRDTTLTGRTVIWNELTAIAAERPFLGWGYGGFWVGKLTPHDLWDKYHFHLKSAHNGYLEIFLELGYVGLFLFVVVIFLAYRNIMETMSVNFEFGALKLTLLIAICTYNITESHFIKPTNLIWFSFILIALNIPKQRAMNSINDKNILEQSPDVKGLTCQFDSSGAMANTLLP